MLQSTAGAILTVDRDGRFRLLVKNGIGKAIVRYPKIQILKNRVRVGCITVSKEAAQKLLAYQETGYLQGES